ncbi:Hsp20/alpha crystallin family protein [Flindersiella endophytica]
MATVAKRDYRHFPDLLDISEVLPGLLSVTALGTRAPRVEEYVADDTYVIRVELPGLDPEKEIKLQVLSGVLSIRAERHEEKHERRHTEFRYGSFARRLELPEGADETKVTARYDAGILEITVPITNGTKEVHTIPIDRVV